MKTPGLGNLQMAYMDMLRLPHGALRVQMQNVLCQLRDQIAELTGEDGETVQNKYEAAVMATASGDALLSALKALYDSIKHMPANRDLLREFCEARDQARAAIAQATPTEG